MGKPYAVTYTDTVPHAGDLAGSTELDEYTMMINRAGPPEDTLDTILHESIHAISSIAGLGIGESQTRTLATALADVLVRNKLIDLGRGKG